MTTPHGPTSSKNPAQMLLWALPVLLIGAVVVGAIFEFSFLSLSPFLVAAIAIGGYYYFAGRR